MLVFCVYFWHHVRCIIARFLLLSIRWRENPSFDCQIWKKMWLSVCKRILFLPLHFYVLACGYQSHLEKKYWNKDSHDAGLLLWFLVRLRAFLYSKRPKPSVYLFSDDSRVSFFIKYSPQCSVIGRLYDYNLYILKFSVYNVLLFVTKTWKASLKPPRRQKPCLQLPHHLEYWRCISHRIQSTHYFTWSDVVVYANLRNPNEGTTCLVLSNLKQIKVKWNYLND